jgi:hypothetical protein
MAVAESNGIPGNGIPLPGKKIGSSVVPVGGISVRPQAAAAKHAI